MHTPSELVIIWEGELATIWRRLPGSASQESQVDNPPGDPMTKFKRQEWLCMDTCYGGCTGTVRQDMARVGKHTMDEAPHLGFAWKGFKRELLCLRWYFVLFHMFSLFSHLLVFLLLDAPLKHVTWHVQMKKDKHDIWVIQLDCLGARMTGFFFFFKLSLSCGCYCRCLGGRGAMFWHSCYYPCANLIH